MFREAHGVCIGHAETLWAQTKHRWPFLFHSHCSMWSWKSMTKLPSSVQYKNQGCQEIFPFVRVRGKICLLFGVHSSMVLQILFLDISSVRLRFWSNTLNRKYKDEAMVFMGVWVEVVGSRFWSQQRLSAFTRWLFIQNAVKEQF